MKIGVIADIHANLLALDAVLAAGDGEGVDEWVCLGDLVGYGPQPRECLERCAERGMRTILGNHEARLLDLPTGRFNSFAEEAIQFSGQQISLEARGELRAFASTIDIEGEALFCHGSPTDRDAYLFGLTEIRAAHRSSTHTLTFVGHTHQQFAFDGEVLRAGPADYVLHPGQRWLVNPGSVGQPRDGDPRAAFAIWNRTDRSLHLRRACYDVTEQIRRALDAGLPEPLAVRLQSGR